MRIGVLHCAIQIGRQLILHRPARLVGLLLALVVAAGVAPLGAAAIEREATNETAVTSAWSPRVTRVAGADRYETAVAVSRQIPRPDSQLHVFIASGEKFPDALSAASAVHSPAFRLLLVKHNRVPQSVQKELARLKPTSVIIVGGTGVVSQAVEDWMWTLPSRPFVERLAGADRYATSLTFAKWLLGEPYPGHHRVSTVVSGRDFPDSLAASAAVTTISQSAFPGPLLLVNGSATSAPKSVRDLLLKAGTIQTRVVGGTGAVSAGIERQLPNPVRYGGADRYETAVRLNSAVFGGAEVAYLATGRSFADALAGTGAGASINAPLYLVRPNCVPRPVLADLERLDVGTVRVLGGSSVLGAGVMSLTPCA